MYRILASLLRGSSEFNDDDEEESHVTDEKVPKQNTEALRDLRETYNQPIKSALHTESRQQLECKNTVAIQRQRELGLINFRKYPTARHNLMQRFLPKEGEVVASMPQSTFCGQFSDDGKWFVSASQDFTIHLFDTTSSKKFEKLAQIELQDVGWAILDTALSPDRSSIAYSTWSPFLYLVKVDGSSTETVVNSLNLRPNTDRFAVFSLQYSTDGSEIIAGSNDRCVYIYDIQKQTRTLRVPAHQNDVNSVRFVDNSNALILSGSDDGLVLVWDRRALNEAHPTPVGCFAGHTSGITFVHSRMDTRYLISNSKDQTIKLWDMRRFANSTTREQSQNMMDINDRMWDYRIGPKPRKFQPQKVEGDPSVQTYRGHGVAFTLIRCYFSPSFTTGQRYIITGSSDGHVYIYDVLTGNIERRLSIRDDRGGSVRERCIRDVSWHPFEPYIISTSWDDRRAHVRWTHRSDEDNEPNLSPPTAETKSRSVQTSLTPPSTPQSTIDPGALQRFLIQQLLGGAYSDEEMLNDE